MRRQNLWLKNVRRNPNIADTIPTKQIVKDDGKPTKKQTLFVCGKMSSKTSIGFFGSDRLVDASCGNGFTIMAARKEKSSHTAFGFGSNHNSQIGYQATRPGFPLEMVTKPSPIYLPTQSPIKAVSAGRAHSLFLNESGQVFSLGLNSLGQCGRQINEKEDYFGSKRVQCLDSDLPRDITSIECGHDHSMFLTNSGQVYSCGWGADGQTGLGHYKNQEKPDLVKGAIEGVKIIKLSSRCDTVLALDDQGNVFGWGNGEYAQFREHAQSNDSQFNVPLSLRFGNLPGKIIDIAAGGTMCAVLNNLGQIFVWGFGILGMGPKVDQVVNPTLIPESLFGKNIYNPEVKVTKIYAGVSHFGAITNLNEFYTWGKNRSSCLGLSHHQDQYFPMRVNVNLGAVRKASLGLEHTSAIVDKVI